MWRAKTYLIAEEAKDGIADACRIFESQRVTDGGDESLVRVFLRDLTRKELCPHGHGPGISQYCESKARKDGIGLHICCLAGTRECRMNTVGTIKDRMLGPAQKQYVPCKRVNERIYEGCNQMIMEYERLKTSSAVDLGTD